MSDDDMSDESKDEVKIPISKGDSKQLSFGETVKLITDFSQELRKQPFPAINGEIIRSLKPVPLDQPIGARLEQRRFAHVASEELPVMVVVKKIENGTVMAEEQSRDASKAPRNFTFSEDEFSRLPYDCPFFFHIQRQYEDYCKQRNVVPFEGFRTIEDMRLFHCGFWLNNATVPRRGQHSAHAAGANMQ
eukprot:TRINITY_DN12625_c0_g1_i2.p1 TRINITY_DN12625_c0_g1~~TRINITY_DN12625_c0_g1_i2.p1  ORF type:complete len:190 (+),score=16.98 TRINITY_DN12625_c0_g1_i2:83-652(+)